MTKRRTPGTFEAAAHQILARFGEGAGDLIGLKGASRIRKATDVDSDNHSPLNLVQALTLDLAYHAETGEGFPHFEAYRAQVEGFDGGKPVSPVARLAAISTEASDVGRVFAAAMDPSSPGGVTITPLEADEIAREGDEAIRAIRNAVADAQRLARGRVDSAEEGA
jgi:hypothetical protein